MLGAYFFLQTGVRPAKNTRAVSQKQGAKNSFEQGLQLPAVFSLPAKPINPAGKRFYKKTGKFL